jgi:hypothetical protein
VAKIQHVRLVVFVVLFSHNEKNNAVFVSFSNKK